MESYTVNAKGFVPIKFEISAEADLPHEELGGLGLTFVSVGMKPDVIVGDGAQFLFNGEESHYIPTDTDLGERHMADLYPNDAATLLARRIESWHIGAKDELSQASIGACVNVDKQIRNKSRVGLLVGALAGGSATVATEAIMNVGPLGDYKLGVLTGCAVVGGLAATIASRYLNWPNLSQIEYSVIATDKISLRAQKVGLTGLMLNSAKQGNVVNLQPEECKHLKLDDEQVAN